MTITDALLAPLLADRLRLCRKWSGLTMREVAERTGITLSHVGAIEHGKSRPGLDSFFSLARVYGVRPTDLYDGPEVTA